MSQEISSGPELHPPGGVREATTPAPRRRGVLLALTGLAAAAVAVVIVLPRLVDDAPKRAESRPDTSPGNARAEAGERLRQYLRVRARMETSKAATWGQPDWAEAATLVEGGDALFARRHFVEAGAAYGRGLETLESLERSREPRLAAALAAAEQALAADDGDTARGHYERALALAPRHPEATHGLARARVRSDVLRYMAEAQRAEARKDVVTARDAYAEALALDADYAPARAAVTRVATAEAERDLRRAMTRALAALDAGQLDDAEAALVIAARLAPDDTAVADAHRRLATAQHQRTVAGLEREADTRARAEDWAGAATLYERALAVTPRAAAARAGLATARARARLHAQLDHYLTAPDRLTSAEPLANAEQLLATAGTAPPGEPRLARKIADLRRDVEQARSPVAVTLRSDGRTEVVIYRVGRLGRFEQHRVELRPGTYTAVGSRTGFRDVRRAFTVRAGSPPPPLLVRCDEPV